MPNTYSQLYIHVIFAVSNRLNLIRPDFKEALQKYIGGIVRNKGQKLIVVNSVGDHIHLLISISPTIAVSDLVRDIKNNSSRFINEQQWVRGVFRWQEGFGAFSCSTSHMKRVIAYILNQEEHHRRTTVQEEFEKFLQEFNVEYEQKYLPLPSGDGDFTPRGVLKRSD